MSFKEKLSNQIDLIKNILSDPKLQNSKNIESKVYSDQPIIMKASHMSGFLPDEYKKMKSVASNPKNLGRPDSWIFVEQGKLMADFEDDYIFCGNVVRYFPTYKALSDSELRGYFSWRTKIRHGVFEKTSLSFAYIYLYELLNLIGCENATDSFRKMQSFVQNYSQLDGEITRYSKSWMFDFVVFHGLDKSVLSDIYDFSAENAVVKLLNHNELENVELFDALQTLSSYNIKRSKLYKLYPDEILNVCAQAYKAYAAHCDKKCEKSLHTRLFGVLLESTHSMMYNAVFYGRNKHPDCEYIISPVHKYSCKAGMWKCTKYFGISENTTNKHVGLILKAVDRILRDKLGVAPALSQGKESKILISIIEKECDKLIAEKRDAEKKHIDIDISKLDGIRISSETIMEKLIVETEEFPEQNLDEETTDAAQELITNAAFTESPLKEQERIFLLKVIDGKGYDEFAASRGFMLSVMADSINEKMYDIIGDSVIEFDGETPKIIEEYVCELEALLKE